MGYLSDIFYFVIVIGVLVLIHEFGHFIAARMTGMRAEVFSIGMGFRLFGFNKINGFTFGKLDEKIELGTHTDYRIAAFPIGGYVKIAGMIDESMDADFAASEPQPWEFRSKNAWQKAFVLSAGVIMNIILAVAIFATIIYTQGEASYSTTEIGYIQKNSLGEKAGFISGDKILSVNGKQVTSWNDVMTFLTTDDFGASRDIRIQRNGAETNLHLEGKKIIKALTDKEAIGIEPAHLKTIILMADANKPAAKAGIKSGDTIIAVQSEQINSFAQFIDILKHNKNKSLYIEWARGGKIIGDTVHTNEEGMIGVQISQMYAGAVSLKEFGFFESIGAGFSQSYNSAGLLINSISQIFKGTISFKQSIGGPIMIAKQASQQAERGILSFLSFMALLSISLAFLNILPFPALDGGHIVFVVVEGVIKREVPLKIKMAIQQAGVVILMLFMAIVLYNDIVR